MSLSDLPNLTIIGAYAFGYNQIQSLKLTNLPNLTTVGDHVFEDNKGVSEYNNWVVAWADDVTYNAIINNKVQVSNGWVVNPVLREKEFTPYTDEDFVIEDGVIGGFTNKGVQKLIDNEYKLVIDGQYISKQLTAIGNDAFYKNQLASLELKDLPNLKTIGERAFSSNQIQSLELKDLPDLTTIGKAAFSSNQIQSLELNNLPSLTTIGDYTFENNELQSL